MRVERWWNDTDRGTPRYRQRNLSKCHFVHNKCHSDWHQTEPVPESHSVVDELKPSGI